ncbi:hypothetical protein SDC9_153946 [bioreactor metagenome]|uniref:Uncharacterized protein n=1 Tax=bioreactor metagenome TaxID=1076179 RepID=A0A645EYZ2_9ZZZZ
MHRGQGDERHGLQRLQPFKPPEQRRHDDAGHNASKQAEQPQPLARPHRQHDDATQRHAGNRRAAQVDLPLMVEPQRVPHCRFDQCHATHAYHGAHHRRRKKRAHARDQRPHGQRHHAIDQRDHRHRSGPMRGHHRGDKRDHEWIGHVHQQGAAAKAPTPGLQRGADRHADQRHRHHRLHAVAIQPRRLGRRQHIGDEGHGRGGMLAAQNQQRAPGQLVVGGIDQIGGTTAGRGCRVP